MGCHTDSVIAGNTITNTSPYAGIYINQQSDIEIRENSVTGGAHDGLVLLSANGGKIYHNNIYGNAGWQVNSDQSELSFLRQRRQLLGSALRRRPLRRAVRSRRGLQRGGRHRLVCVRRRERLEQEIDPGCGPPPPGWIAGEVWDDAGPVAAVRIGLEDSGETPINETVTDIYGDYGFEELEPGIYFVSLIVPIGYAPDSETHVEAIVNSGEETWIDFTLERLVVEVDTRAMGYWKHQAKAHVTGRGQTDESVDPRVGYLDDTPTTSTTCSTMSSISTGCSRRWRLRTHPPCARLPNRN